MEACERSLKFSDSLRRKNTIMRSIINVMWNSPNNYDDYTEGTYMRRNKSMQIKPGY